MKICKSDLHPVKLSLSIHPVGNILQLNTLRQTVILECKLDHKQCTESNLQVQLLKYAGLERINVERA